MAPYKRRNRNRRPKRVARKSYARKGRSLAPVSIKKMIRSEIARNIENKTTQFVVANKVLYPSNAALFQDNVIPLGINATTLPLNQSFGQGGRVANQVRTKKLQMKGILTTTPWNTTTNPNPRPLIARIVVFYDREDPNDVPALTGTTFFQQGSSTAGFSNDMTDIIRPFNSDRYRILMTKNFKLGCSAYNGTQTSTTISVGHQYYQNNDYKLSCPFTLNLTKHYPKVVKFNDNLSYPMTRGLYAVVYYVDGTGDNLNATHILADMTYMLTYDYEDA